MRGDNRTKLADAGDRLLASMLAALVDAAPARFAQAILDLAPARMAFGRAVLLGDTECVVRPHTAAGIAKRRTTRLVSPKHCATSPAVPRLTPRWRAGMLISGRPARCCPRAESRSAHG
ncbi:hypothetical protein [Burkholderia sp. BCC1993]|uniref:hypothetical protein n=1 Tax=Burkholderia sp. BCC1993 TaxID=2817444 RepID=UPI002AB13C07|nr:hypothetical protein [Burkholderia sp. BCC1993]